MNARTVMFMAVAALLAVIALTIGSGLLLRAAVCIALMLILAFLSVMSAYITVNVTISCRSNAICRSESADVQINAVFRGILPLGTLQYVNSEVVCLSALPFVRSHGIIKIRYPHKGLYRPCMGKVIISDVFGLFELRKTVGTNESLLTVLPLKRMVETIKSETHDSTEGTTAVTDDADAPSSVRGWVDGDLIKRIHWKLTLKNYSLDGELKPIVRTYDEASKPDILVCPMLSRVNAPDEKRLDIEDCVCDTALSVFNELCCSGESPRMLLCDNTMREIDDAEEAGYALAEAAFENSVAFEVLAGEVLRRAGRTGAAVFITAALSLKDADVLLRLRAHTQTEMQLFWITDSWINDVKNVRARLLASGIRVRLIDMDELNEKNA